jgi:hypothetical protein
MPENQIGLFVKWIGAGITMLGSFFGAGKVYGNLVKKKELYDPKNGSQIYLTVEESKENIENCKTDREKELAGINSRLDKISKNLITTNEERIKTANLLGRIEQYMENNKK